MRKQTSTLTTYGVAITRAMALYKLDSKTLFKQAGLDIEAMKNPNARYPDTGLNHLVRMVEERTGDQTFGLAIARFIAPTTLHALGFSLFASETLLAALQRLQRYYRIVNDAVVINVEKGKTDYRVRIDFVNPDMPPEACLTDALVAVLVNISRQLLDAEFAPLKIDLQRARPDNEKPFTDYFRTAIGYAAEQNMLVFDKNASIKPLPTGNAELAYQNDKMVADYLARFDANRLSERVRTIFIERLVTGKFSEEQIAEQLNLSLRSLQRRLRDEQTSYQQLLDETRLELALQYINRTRLTVSQIAPLLGFSDSSNFNRAFKRWLGISPSKYRALGFT